MRAQFVNENLNFERGLNPKRAIDVGLSRDIDKFDSPREFIQWVVFNSKRLFGIELNADNVIPIGNSDSIIAQDTFTKIFTSTLYNLLDKVKVGNINLKPFEFINWLRHYFDPSFDEKEEKGFTRFF